MSPRYIFNDEAEILRTYQISSVSKLERWEVVDTRVDDSATGTATLKGDEQDALGLRRGGTLSVLQPDASTQLKHAVLIQSKAFDPKVYLSQIHPKATFKDLSRGRENLKDSLEQRSEALKILVEQEFDRFVGIKAATGSVFAEMKQGPLSEGSDYGVKELRSAINEATSKANSVYTPILDAAMKANRLRSTLTVFERSKFFFNLPETLLEAIEAKRYEAALLAYKKGQYMLDGRPQPLLGLPPSAETTLVQEQQAKRIYDKVWGQVQRIMGDLKNVLVKRLRDTRISIEEVEKVIDTLLALDPSSDPAWSYLETQHKRILERLKQVYSTMADAHSLAAQLDSQTQLDDKMFISVLRRSLDTVDGPAFEHLSNNAHGSKSWHAIANLSKALCETLLTSLPTFWKVASAHQQGKYQKQPTTNRGLGSPSANMTNDIVNCFVSLLSQFFQLGIPSESTSDDPPLPTFLPTQSNAVLIASHLSRLQADLLDAIDESIALHLPKEAANNLKDFALSLRWGLEDALCIAWVRDAKILYKLETWTANPDESSTTIYLKIADAYQRSIARRAYRLAGGPEDHANTIFQPAHGQHSRMNLGNPDPLPQQFVQRIKSAFLDSLYAFLDGLVHVSFSEPEHPPKEIEDIRRDITNIDIRILLTVSNLAYLNEAAITAMIGQFERAFRVQMASEVATLKDVVKQLDKILFDDFVKRKTEELNALLRRGILENGFDWLNAPKPTEVHSYIYEALLSLVLVHAQTTAVARPLVHRVLSALVHEISVIALACFVNVQQFGMGGMLQATLEIEFLHQTLAQFVTPQADVKLQEIYKTISQSYTRKPDSSENASELQQALEQVKKILGASRKATALQFLCFRKQSTLKDPNSLK